MAVCIPFHTTTHEYGDHRNVHHDRDDCPDGKRIKSEHRIYNEGQKPQCKECIKLGG